MSSGDRLLCSQSWDPLWTEALHDWFKAAAAQGWKSEKPWVAVLPSRSHIFFLKRHALTAHVPLLGMSLWTPGELRTFLLRHLAPDIRVPSRENLQLLLALAAAGQQTELARAVAADPAPLLRALDAWQNGGQALNDFPASDPALAAVLKQFSKMLPNCRLTPVQAADRALQTAAAKTEPLLERLLLLGFSGEHWALWPLLQAAVHSARQRLLCLGWPRLKAEGIDQLWQASWEQVLNCEAELVPPDSKASADFVALAEHLENPEHAPGDFLSDRVHFLMGRTFIQEAQALGLRVAQTLCTHGDAQVAVLLPGPGPLARELGLCLDQLELPHFDHLGYTAPVYDDLDRWLAWLAFQRHPRLIPLLAWLKTHSKLLEPLALTESELHATLQKAYNMTLSDDLKVLAAWLEHQNNILAQTVAGFLQQLAILPESAPLSEFLVRSEHILSGLGWEQRALWLREHSMDLSAAGQILCQRSVFVHWLGEVCAQNQRRRHPSGQHPYARVHLLTYAQAEGQPWTHVIFAGLNEGQCPPAQNDLDFLNADAIQAANARQCRSGSQGVGHQIVPATGGWILDAASQRAVLQRKFLNILESASEHLSLSAALLKADAMDRPWQASDWYAKLFTAVEKKPLDAAALQGLAAQTHAWLETHKTLWPHPASTDRDPASIAAASSAYRQRQDPDQAFGPYEFALSMPPETPLTLSCKEWQDALRQPALVFLKRVLHVSAQTDFAAEDRSALCIGTWVHQWLHAACVELWPTCTTHPFEAWERSVQTAAALTQQAVSKAYTAAGQTLPGWWQALWGEAQHQAAQLAYQISQTQPGWAYGYSELPLPAHLNVAVGAASPLRLTGRLDALLCESAADLKQARPFKGQSLWVFDFKTGHPKTFTAGEFKKGHQLQIALYALALQALGASAVRLSLLYAGEAELKSLSLDDLTELTPVWQALSRMQQSAVFGQAFTSEYDAAFEAPLPLATLPIPAETLQRKWQLHYPEIERK